jgi:hypothetical protein
MRHPIGDDTAIELEVRKQRILRGGGHRGAGAAPQQCRHHAEHALDVVLRRPVAG